MKHLVDKSTDNAKPHQFDLLSWKQQKTTSIFVTNGGRKSKATSGGRKQSILLRAAASKNQEPHFTDRQLEFLIFRLKIPLDLLCLKIIF